jgi:signal transduction histidine kinase
MQEKHGFIGFAMNFTAGLARIALWKKFTCLGVLCLALVFLPTLLYWREVNKSLVFAATERQGLPQAQLILNIIQRTQQHRGISAQFLQDLNMPKREQRTKAEDLEESIFAYEVFLDRNPNPQHREMFSNMVTYWHGLHRKIAHKDASVAESFELHTLLIQKQLDYLQAIVDAYQLSLDPEKDGYFLIDASLMRLPDVAEILGQIRGYGVGLLAKGSATLDERAHLKALLLMSQSKMNALDSSIKKADLVRKKNRENIYQNYQATAAQYQKIVELVQNEILNKEQFIYSPDDFYSAFTLGVNSYYGYAHFAIEQVNSILMERIAAKRNAMLALLTYVILLTLVVGFICTRFVRHLLRELGGEPQYATDVVQAITRGDLDCEIESNHDDSLLANMRRMQKKLKENDRLKSEFVSTVSHELRTPLTAIGGALSLSVSGQLGELPEPAKNLLDIAQKNSVRLTELVNDLLDIDKLSLGKLELDMRIQPLMPIIDDACQSMTSYIQKYGAHLSMGPRFEYTLVKVDARRLRQILINFLSNAAKFSHEGDEIIINASVHAETVRIEVVDHGTGIPEAFHEKIFEKFSQADASDNRLIGGTGLGLAIAKELIQQMNGHIGFSSTPGVGSCFYIELPLEEPNSD